MSLRKAGKAVQKLLQGQFSELADRGRELLQVRRERQHFERGDLHFTSEKFAEIFLKSFRREFASEHDELDFVAALRSHECFKFYPGFGRNERFAEMLRAARPDEAERIIQTADEIVSGRFPIFSLGYLDYGDPPRWNYDPVHERTAPDQFYGDIEYLKAKVCGDAKVVWEPARFQFGYDLGQAYLLTGDKKYAEKFFALVRHWSESHADYRGIGFCSALEFAFRAHSLCWGIGCFGGSPSLDPHTASCIYRIIELSAHFISNHLSLWFSPNTHLLGEAYALYLIGSRFPEFASAVRWRELGHAILSEELDRQFTLDGMHAELSTAYHAYAVEFYLSAYLIAGAAGDPLRERIEARLPGMVEVLRALQRPDGAWPHIGDEDGGRLFFLSRVDSGDFRPLLEVATLRERGGVGQPQVGHYVESFWLNGAELKADVASKVVSPESHTLFNTGLFVARDKESKSQAILQFGPFGYLDSPHSHADMLHLDLSVGADNFIVDPGTFAYTADLDARNRFRSATYHNGPALDGAALLRQDDPFGWQQQPDVHCARHVLSETFGFCRAGYTRLQNQFEAELKRSLFSLGGGCWLLWDCVNARSPQQVSWTFISPLSLINDAGAIRIVGSEGQLLLLPLTPAGTALEVAIDEAEISKDYLSRESAQAFHLRVSSSSQAQLFMLMQWLPLSNETRSYLKRAECKGDACFWQTEQRTHHLLIGSDSEGRGQFGTDAEVAYLKEVDGKPVRMTLIEGSEITCAGDRLIAGKEKLNYVDAILGNSGWSLDTNPAGTEVEVTAEVRRKK